jgi:hypothetical protein
MNTSDQLIQPHKIYFYFWAEEFLEPLPEGILFYAQSQDRFAYDVTGEYIIERKLPPYNIFSVAESLEKDGFKNINWY